MSDPSDITPEQAREWGWKDRAEAFANWRNAVNHEVVRISTLGLDDLPDYDFSTAFTSEMSPKETALEVLENADFPLEDEDFEE